MRLKIYLRMCVPCASLSFLNILCGTEKGADLLYVPQLKETNDQLSHLRMTLVTRLHSPCLELYSGIEMYIRIMLASSTGQRYFLIPNRGWTDWIP